MSGKVLVIDTSSKYLYFSFLDDNKLIYEVFLEGKNNHSENLLVEIEKGLNKFNLTLKDFKKIIVGIGPGSYTGLRVGVTVSKVLAWTTSTPIYEISSLDLLASNYLSNDGIYAITMKAKKDYIYGKLVEVKEGKVNEIISDNFFNEKEFIDMINKYDYKLINEDNYKVNPFNLKPKLVSNVHNLSPNYIQKGI